MNPDTIFDTLFEVWTGPCSWDIVVIFLLVLILVIAARMRIQPKEIVAFETATGQIKVSKHAIVELVKRACQLTEGLGKTRSKVSTRKSLKIDIHIQLLGGYKLRDVSDALNEQINHCLKKDLGLTDIGNINIIADGYINDGNVINTPKLAEPEPEQSFSSEDDNNYSNENSTASDDTDPSDPDRKNMF